MEGIPVRIDDLEDFLWCPIAIAHNYTLRLEVAVIAICCASMGVSHESRPPGGQDSEKQYRVFESRNTFEAREEYEGRMAGKTSSVVPQSLPPPHPRITRRQIPQRQIDRFKLFLEDYAL